VSKAFIYAVGADWTGPVKIGVASDVARRLERLQSGNHVLLSALWTSHGLSDPFAVEAALHREFDKYRIRGEWFSIPGLSAAMLEEAVERLKADAVSRRHAPKADTSFATILAVRTLIDCAKREGLSTEDAIGKVASDADVGRSLVWALCYRPPADVWTSDYARIAAATFKAAGKPGFTVDEIPSSITLRLVVLQLRHARGLPEIENRAALISEAEASLGTPVQPEYESRER
jgi:hypothetical protein